MLEVFQKTHINVIYDSELIRKNVLKATATAISPGKSPNLKWTFVWRVNGEVVSSEKKVLVEGLTPQNNQNVIVLTATLPGVGSKRKTVIISSTGKQNAVFPLFVF